MPGKFKPSFRKPHLFARTRAAILRNLAKQPKPVVPEPAPVVAPVVDEEVKPVVTTRIKYPDSE